MARHTPGIEPVELMNRKRSASDLSMVLTNFTLSPDRVAGRSVAKAALSGGLSGSESTGAQTLQEGHVQAHWYTPAPPQPASRAVDRYSPTRCTRRMRWGQPTDSF